MGQVVPGVTHGWLEVGDSRGFAVQGGGRGFAVEGGSKNWVAVEGSTAVYKAGGSRHRDLVLGAGTSRAVSGCSLDKVQGQPLGD